VLVASLRYLKCAAAHFKYYRPKVVMCSFEFPPAIAKASGHRNST
jgi:hypothetical protein